MRIRNIAALPLLCLCCSFSAQGADSFDAAAAFGARQSVVNLALSPDGMNVAYLSPTRGQGSALYSLNLTKGAKARLAVQTTGAPERLERCDWVSNERLVCVVYGVVKEPMSLELVPMSRVVAVNADGSNFKVLSTLTNSRSRSKLLYGGEVIDWLPDEGGAVLMTRLYSPNDRIGSHLGSTDEGVGVDRIDTSTLAVKRIEPPRATTDIYLTDGRGNVRIQGLTTHKQQTQDTGIYNFSYRLNDSREWQALANYKIMDRTGFWPVAIDHDLNIVYGFKKKDGRMAVYSMSLDGKLSETLVYAHPDVDVDELIRVGRRQRVVGVSYAADVRTAVYIDPSIQRLMASLSKALPGQPRLRIADTSLDESKLLVFADKDNDPGVYYLFDRKTHQMETFLVARGELEGHKLASVQSVSYPAADGVMIPGYLTLPPGKETAKGLPAIVLPHGGPSARDEWGFDWLSQFYADRGYAVLQPNFRGSSGYGDAWFKDNGFKSWPTAIGDVLAGGQWLVKQGIADPAKLGVVGWSYGGYAALQSAVVDPTLFKAVVAIAPVTDLAALKEERRYWSNFELTNDYVGSGPHIHDGSPAEQAAKIKAPVLLFHGAFDRNVGIAQSKRMQERVTAAGGRCELVSWEALDHYLDDSAARTEMLRKSDAFLRQAMGL